MNKRVGSAPWMQHEPNSFAACYHTMHRIHFVAAAIMALLIQASAWSQCEADHVIAVADFYFAPSELVIAPGESVAFVNAQGTHDVNGIANTLTGEPFGNPVDFYLATTEGTVEGTCMGVVTFDVPGVYQFDSSIGLQAQLGMVGQITVDAYTLTDLLNETQLDFEAQGYTAWQTSWALNSYWGSLLAGVDTFTVFAPTDAAVEAVGELMNLNQFDLLAFYDLPDALAYHIVPGLYTASDLVAGMELPTVQGQTLSVTTSDAGIEINGAQVLLADIAADNGVVHLINQTLAPEGYPSATVLDVIQTRDDLSLFESAVFDAFLDDDLRGQPVLNDNEPAPGPFTVFAPSDQALIDFAAANGFTSVEALLASQYMEEILQQHIVETEWLAAELYNNQVLLSYGGEALTIEVAGSDIAVNGAPVGLPDQLAYNGVVHVLDAVMPFTFPNPVGTCGTWTLNLFDNAGDGWETPMYVQVDGEVVATATLNGGYTDAYAFAVDEGSLVNLIRSGNGVQGEAFEVIDAEGTLVWQWAGNFSSNASPAIFGLEPCRPEPTCGYVDVTVFDTYGDGWDYGSLGIYVEEELVTTIPGLVSGEAFFEFSEARARIAVEEGQALSFVFNNGVFPEECGYLVTGPTGEILVDENTPNEAPSSTYNVTVCATNGLAETSAATSLEIGPNPSGGTLRLSGLHSAAAWTLAVVDLRGQLVAQHRGTGATTLQLDGLVPGTYTLQWVLATGERLNAKWVKR